MATEDSFLGRGWGFPPTFTTAGADVAMAAGVEDVHQSLQILLATQPGERVMQDSFGCDLSGMLFEEVDHAFVNRVKQLVGNAILKHEPRVNLDTVDVSDVDAERGKVVISIEYTIRSSNSRFNMVFPFYVAEARVPGG
jgi:hypothetical protein